MSEKPIIDLNYNPDSFVGPFNMEELKKHERSSTVDYPHMKYDASYVTHISKFHGGIPGKQWFRSKSGKKHRLGRFLNFATESSLPEPFQPSWIDSRVDIRWEWSLTRALAIANIADGCGAFLVPFAILYSGPHHPDEMDLTHLNLVCFNYRKQGRPRVVVWYNNEAVSEFFRCEEQGLDPWTELDYLKFTEDVAENFDEFLMMLYKSPDDVPNPLTR